MVRPGSVDLSTRAHIDQFVREFIVGTHDARAIREYLDDDKSRFVVQHNLLDIFYLHLPVALCMHNVVIYPTSLECDLTWTVGGVQVHHLVDLFPEE